MINQPYIERKPTVITERAVGRVKEGTCGTNGATWSTQKLAERSYGMVLYLRRLLMKGGLGTLFEAARAYHPISSKDRSRLHHSGPKDLPGLFIGYAHFAGGKLDRRSADSGRGRNKETSCIRDPRQKQVTKPNELEVQKVNRPTCVSLRKRISSARRTSRSFSFLCSFECSGKFLGNE